MHYRILLFGGGQQIDDAVNLPGVVRQGFHPNAEDVTAASLPLPISKTRDAIWPPVSLQTSGEKIVMVSLELLEVIRRG